MLNDKNYWFKHIRKWEQSQLTQHGYCNAHDLNHTRFGAYRMEYLKDNYKNRYRRTTLNIFALVEVHDYDKRSDAPEVKPIIINLPNGIDITVSDDFKLDH